MDAMDFSNQEPRFTDESPCVGKAGCCKCETCTRLRPRSDFNDSFLLTPPGHTKRCPAFKAIH